MTSPSNYSTYKHNVSWEEVHGYVQVVRVSETVYFSGQFAHEGEKLRLKATSPHSVTLRLQTWTSVWRRLGPHATKLYTRKCSWSISQEHGRLGTQAQAILWCSSSGVRGVGRHGTGSTSHAGGDQIHGASGLAKGPQALANGMPWEEEFNIGNIVACGSTVEVSGQFDHDDDGKPTGIDDFIAQCVQTFKNIDERLAEICATRSQIVYTEVLVMDIHDNVEKTNAAHKNFFGSHRHASTCFGVTGLSMPYVKLEIKFTVRLDLPANPKTFLHGLPWEDSHNYSQVVIAGNTAWISGQLAHDAEGNPGDEHVFDKQCEAAFTNLDKCLEVIGATRSQVVHAGSMVVELSENIEQFSAAHKKYFGACPPVSTVWGVPGFSLPFMKVEICAIVRLNAPNKP